MQPTAGGTSPLHGPDGAMPREAYTNWVIGQNVERH